MAIFRVILFQLVRAIPFLAVSLAIASPAQAQGNRSDDNQQCDRACMTGMITLYVDALIAHDPDILPLTQNVKVTQGGLSAELGENYWQSITGATGFRHDYIDVEKQVAAAHVELREGDVPVLYSLLLHIEGQRIAGIETLVHRVTPQSIFQPKVLGAPIRGMDDPVPEGQAMDRGELLRIALSYTDGLRMGNFTDAGVPFAADTYRVENGVITAGEGGAFGDCGMYSQRIMTHPAILPSVAVVDEEAGTVLLWMNFGDTGSYGQDTALITFEAFKIWGGKIRSINAFFDFLPANRSRFWNSTDRVQTDQH